MCHKVFSTLSQLLYLVTFFFLLFSTGCKELRTQNPSTTGASSPDSGKHKQSKINILCTTAQVASLVSPVVGDLGEITILIQGQSDPHSYQLVKGDDEKFLRADIVFASGLGLEHSPSIIRQLLRKPTFIVGDVILKMQPEQIIRFNGVPDPHVWMDVSLWASTVPAIVERLSKVYPEGAATFAQRGEKVHAELLRVHEEMLTILKAVPKERRYLVTTHDAFSYFTRAYLAEESERENNTWWERCFAPEGLAPDAQISTQDIVETVEKIVEHKVRYIFAESNVSQDSIRRVAEICLQRGHLLEIAPQPLYADAMGAKGSLTASYSGMMLYNASTIARLFQGTAPL